MAQDDARSIGADGIFKLLAWRTRAITRILGLPDIEGPPVQQEYRFPMERRVDGLYRLADVSYLHIEHQSTLKGKDDLARRLVTYHVMIKQEFPDAPLLQAVIHTGRGSPSARRIGKSLKYVSRDASGRHGLRFSAMLVDFRTTPVDEFRKSGLIDDLILGLMTRGGDDEVYIKEVIARIRSIEGEARRDAIEKFVAVCAITPERKAGQMVLGEKLMWPDEVKDSPFVKQLFELVEKDRIIRERRLTLARLLVAHANKMKLNPPADAEPMLVEHADEETLFAMANDMENMSDFLGFARSHGVDIF